MSQENVPPRYLTYAQAAQYTGLSDATIRRAERRGELRSSGHHTNTRFDIRELDRWMAERP